MHEQQIMPSVLNGRIALIITAMMITGACCNSPPHGLHVDDLRYENLTNPLGIDTTVPHFSWKLLSDQNGTKQKASDTGMFLYLATHKS